MAANTNSRSVAKIFRAALKRKQALQTAYSLRALARDLGVSPAFVSKVMSGEKLPPRERLEKLCYLLELDVLEKEFVVKTVMLDSFGTKVLSRIDAKPRRTVGTKGPRTTSDAPSRQVLGSWMNLAVLEGLTLRPPHCEPGALRERLGLTEAQWKQTIQTLLNAGLIEERDGRYQKKDELLYIAGGRSRAEVRAFHEMMILKARAELNEKTLQADYERRLINGFTVAVNPDNVEQVKAKILRFMDEITREAAAGECKEVYQLNVQFFPLTKKVQG